MGIPNHYPEGVQAALCALIASVTKLEGVRDLVVYGSLARGNFREGESDVNLALVLERADLELLGALGEPLRVASAERRIEPFIVTRAELPRLADVFPIKLLDIQRYHDVIHGDDAFLSIEVGWSDMRVRVEQELRNQLLRLRRTWVFGRQDPRSLGRALYGAATSLALELDAMLWLRGARADGVVPELVFAKAASAFDLNPAPLLALAAFKGGGPVSELARLFEGVLLVIEQAIRVVDLLEAPR